MEELVEAFDYRHMSKSPAVFDTVKLKWMNGEYLKAMDFDRFYELAEPYLKKAVTKDDDLKKIAALVKTRIEILPDICEQIDFFEEVPEYDNELYRHKKMKTDPEILCLRHSKVLRERKNIRSVMLCGRFVLQYQANRTHRAEQQN